MWEELSTEKAILVIDKPSSCIECRYSLFGGCYCTLTQEDLIVKDGDISENCPLKPMPLKMKADYDTIATCEVTEKVVAMGWNACIETILGEEE